MRSYGQHCGLAKALDIVGDRWTLLIVRELLILTSCRYTDLLKGLPGIATNLLAGRLRDLEQAGIVSREEAPSPVSTTLFQLTARGRELEPVILRLGLWGAPLLAESGPDDAFCSHWLVIPLQHHLKDHVNGPPVTIELRTGGEALTLEVGGGGVRTRLGSATHSDAVLAGTPQLVLGVLLGKHNLKAARAAGLRYDGSPAILDRLQSR